MTIVSGSITIADIYGEKNICLINGMVIHGAVYHGAILLLYGFVIYPNHKKIMKPETHLQ